MLLPNPKSTTKCCAFLWWGQDAVMCPVFWIRCPDLWTPKSFTEVHAPEFIKVYLQHAGVCRLPESPTVQMLLVGQVRMMSQRVGQCNIQMLQTFWTTSWQRMEENTAQEENLNICYCQFYVNGTFWSAFLIAVGKSMFITSTA